MILLQVRLHAANKREVTVPAAVFRKRAQAGTLRVGWAVAPADMRGCILPKVVIKARGTTQPPFVIFSMMSRVQGLNLSNVSFATERQQIHVGWQEH